jgi:DNA segregation ATPase FtsK/SpoIIIE-like protein
MDIFSEIILGGIAILIAAIALALAKISGQMKDILLKESLREEEMAQILERMSTLQAAYYTDTMTGINKLGKITREDDGESLFGNADGEGDELYEKAKELVIQGGKASASILQRKLRVGYARAARLLDLLEEEGIIGPADGEKPREIMENE